MELGEISFCKFAENIDKNALNNTGILEKSLVFVVFNDKVNRSLLTKEYKSINTETGVIDSD